MALKFKGSGNVTLEIISLKVTLSDNKWFNLYKQAPLNASAREESWLPYKPFINFKDELIRHGQLSKLE
jgi:hypothetical protein